MDAMQVKEDIKVIALDILKDLLLVNGIKANGIVNEFESRFVKELNNHPLFHIKYE